MHEESEIMIPIHRSVSDMDRDKKRRVILHTTRRVLAPYVKARHKKKAREVENKYFSFYVQRKPSILLRDTRMLFEGDKLMDVFDETATILKEITESSEVRIYMVNAAEDEIYELRERSVEEEIRRVSFKIDTASTVAAYVACTKKSVKIGDLLEDARFPCGLGHNEVTVKSVLCAPVLTPQGDCLGVIQLHRDMEDYEYDTTDLDVVSVMCAWIGATIYQSQQKDLLQREQELNEYLLEICKCYFADTMLLEKLIAEVVNFAKIALNAEHGGFYVLKERNEFTFATYYEGSDETNPDQLSKSFIRIRTGADADVLGLVVNTGFPVNIKNAAKDARVKHDIDIGYCVRSVLCVPILNGDKVIGILQVVNKRNGVCFRKGDEILLNTFSVYCGFVLKYASLYEEMANTNNLNCIYIEMLEHHMVPCVHDYYMLSSHTEQPPIPPRFLDFDFLLEEYQDYLPRLVIYMFDQISKETFDNLEVKCKFVLTVRKSYRDHPYNNYLHAFYVLHTMFCIIKRNREYFSLTQARALMIAAYCHAIDHTGKTGQFLKLDNHYLSQLYDEAFLENHHFQVTVFIIQLFKLFQYMSQKQYEELLGEIKYCILCTDICTFLKNKKRLLNICKRGLDWHNRSEKDLFISLIVTMSDLTEYCKVFTKSKDAVDARFREHYEEGDIAKEKGLCPNSMYDRHKSSSIAGYQVQFMNLIVLPCAEIISKILPNCYSLYKEGAKNKELWEEIINMQGQKLWTLEESWPDRKYRV